jgi:DNA-binding NtrC family response regulator
MISVPDIPPAEQEDPAAWISEFRGHSIIAASESMHALYLRIQAIASSSASILIVGETGVGKELIAEYIHRASPRAHHPFIKVGLATLPPELLESELFGHEAGAYTHALREKKGLFELAHRGTILLDDIDDFPRHLQVKLLRVLEEGELMHVGGTKRIPIDTRVICATKVRLKELVERGAFRSDLYYRINVVPITIPPLRERRADIPVLIEHFLHRYAPDSDVFIDEEAARRLQLYTWPGNVRELRNVVQRLALFSRGRVRSTDLPNEISEEAGFRRMLSRCAHCFNDGHLPLDELLSCLEYNLILQALRESRGNRAEAARTLGLKLSTLRDRLEKYHIDADQHRSPQAP